MGCEVAAGFQGLGDRKRPIVISGPSGVGKGTLINKLMAEFPSSFGFSVSHTTRAPRDKEKDGVHYHFTERRVMEEDIKDGRFLEFATVHGNLYGTSLKAVNVVADSGKRCILDIDVQGARLVRAAPFDAVFIFISPPSTDELGNRLRSRGTETEEQIVRRVKNSQEEVEQSRCPGLFDHILVNDELEGCYLQLKKLLNVEEGDHVGEVAESTEDEEPRTMVDAAKRDCGLVVVRLGREEEDRGVDELFVMDVSAIQEGAGAPERTCGGLKLPSPPRPSFCNGSC